MSKPRDPKVWVVNYAGHDYSDAKRFGELDFITKGYVSRGHPDRLLYDVSETIAETEPFDWLLPSGLIALNVLAVVVWKQKHGSVNLLLHDPKEDCYQPTKITTEQVGDLLDTLAIPDGEPTSN